MFYFKSYFWEERDKITNKAERQNSLSPEEKEQKMNSSMIVVIGIALFIIVLAAIGFITMWRERNIKD